MAFHLFFLKEKHFLKLKRLATKKIYKEHIENYCFDYPRKFKIYPNRYKKKYHGSNIKLTLDTIEDFKKLKKLNNVIKIDSKKNFLLKNIEVF